MNGSEPKLPGLTHEEIDQLMDPQLSVEDRMTVWQAKPLNVQARKVLRQINGRAMRRHYVAGQTCLGVALTLWLLIPFLPATSQIFDMQEVRLSLYVSTLSVFIFGLFQAWAMTRANTIIEEI